jgi:hypothetical protein
MIIVYLWQKCAKTCRLGRWNNLKTIKPVNHEKNTGAVMLACCILPFPLHAERIDRKAVETRHQPHVTSLDALSADSGQRRLCLHR